MKLKLKPVVASLVLLGLMAPAFARDGSAKMIATQEAVVNQNSLINEVCSEKWFDRITIGGAASVAGILGNTDLPGQFSQTGNGSDLYVNNVNVLVDATLNKWSKATLNLAYWGAPSAFYRTSDIAQSYHVDNRIFANEYYITFADFARSPLFAKVGKAYVPFGEYNDQFVPWQFESPAQMIAMTNGPTAIVGVASDFGFYLSLFGLKGDTAPLNSTTNNIRNFGGKIGYHDNLSRFESPNTNFNVNLSYIRNIWDSQFFTANTNSSWGVSTDNTTQRDPVGGLGVHVDMSYKAFSAYADWVGALKNMASTYSTDAYSVYPNSSKFWGANVNAAYAFETLSHDSSIGAGVQFSGNGQWFATAAKNGNVGVPSANKGLYDYLIPKWRGLVEYKVNLIKHTDLSLMYAHSKSYDFAADGNNGRNTNVGLARLGVRF
jgi:hypothetical protein